MCQDFSHTSLCPSKTWRENRAKQVAQEFLRKPLERYLLLILDPDSKTLIGETSPPTPHDGMLKVRGSHKQGSLGDHSALSKHKEGAVTIAAMIYPNLYPAEGRKFYPKE